MEEHYIKDVGKITYVYDINLEEHKTVVEKQQKRIAELEKQLDQLKQQNEELMLQLSKYEIEKHKPAYCTLAGTECEYLGNVHELKQQLAEKDKEIEVLRKGEYQKCCQHCDAFEELVAISKQEQKELAIQELEKVKDFAFKNTMLGIETVAVMNQIDQQIKELKGEKDVED